MQYCVLGYIGFCMETHIIMEMSYAGSHQDGPGEIIISASSLYYTVVTEFFEVNSSQLLWAENLFSETSSLALLAKNKTGGCHKWDRVAGVTQCSDRNSTPCSGISTAIPNRDF